MKNFVITVVGLAACAAGNALADDSQSFLLSNDNYALGGNRTYYQTSPDTMFHIGNLDIAVTMNFIMTGDAHTPPAPAGGPSFGQSDGTAVIRFSLGGQSLSNASVLASMNCNYVDAFNSFSHAGAWRTFDTEMLSMTLVANPVWANGPVMLRESPTLQSPGSYTVQTLPADGGYRITSFFDIFTELSLDGGQTWTPGDSAMHVELGPTIPSPGSACLLALSAAFASRRRRD